MTAPHDCPYPLLVGDVYVHACDRWWWQVIDTPDPDDTGTAPARVELPDVSAIACSCDADLVVPHPLHLPWPKLEDDQP